jgi:hypothetical protein
VPSRVVRVENQIPDDGVGAATEEASVRSVGFGLTSAGGADELLVDGGIVKNL